MNYKNVTTEIRLEKADMEPLCPPGFYGVYCSEKCPSTCRNETCNATTGVCQACAAGFEMPLCYPAKLPSRGKAMSDSREILVVTCIAIIVTLTALGIIVKKKCRPLPHPSLRGKESESRRGVKLSLAPEFMLLHSHDSLRPMIDEHKEDSEHKENPKPNTERTSRADLPVRKIKWSTVLDEQPSQEHSSRPISPSAEWKSVTKTERNDLPVA